MPDTQTVILAFSGGLDTSFCLLYLKEKHGYDVITATIDTGGFSPDELRDIEQRAAELGATRHITVDARRQVFDDHIAYLIKGNVLRGNTYPLCVGAERVVQARRVAVLAHELGADAIAHGSTGAGNDQIRFDVALRALCPDTPILTPVRDEAWSREASAAFLAERGVHIPPKTTTYSVNVGLWGVTIGGKETHDSFATPPDDAYVWTTPPAQAPAHGHTFTLAFDQGLPTHIDEQPLDSVPLVEHLNQLGGSHGVGRGIHLGDTILGIKGRIAFEAPAAAILNLAHQELEKLVLTRWQQHWKAQLGSFYGMLLHEAHYLDPVMRDLEAFIDSSQSAVSGLVKVHICQGRVEIQGVSSPHSMMDAAAGTYGERNTLWTGADARGFCTIYGTQELLAMRASKGSKSS